MTKSVQATPEQSEIPFLDITKPGFSYDSPEVAAARERHWYAESPVGLIVLRHAEAQALMRDPRFDHDGAGFMRMNGVEDGPIWDWYVPMLVNHDGADHRRLRGLVHKAFTPRTVNDLRPFVRAQARRLADSLAATEVCDFFADFGNPLPLAVMSRLLGVPEQDWEIFRTWTTDLGLVFSLAHGGDFRERVTAAVVGLYGYVDALMDAKAAHPADDLISRLVLAQREDQPVSRAELLNLLVTLVFAAHDTTRHQLANAMVAFADHPDQWRLLGRRPGLIPTAVDETIRWAPSSVSVFRFATEDLEFQGTFLAKGTFLLICSPAAQRDPRAYQGADTFDVTAGDREPAVQFGGGPHYCLGAALAKVELSEAFAALTERLGPPTVAEPFTWRPPIGILGPTSLSLRFADAQP
ncbi:cytochrome P450 [Actinokineospora iranica]|uniref:Cytochrome P450 n=1 Tax=Actinokineospora iranica TaxID=1271860 RepID=A0A1G6Z330_9PSEU|nr:cytochrome P450 [Actinokineospora iranica]SDD97069.1 hypothetical protein SAMN05216174_12533 [Actinokineospora iranica]